jgi:hypothetical protein
LEVDKARSSLRTIKRPLADPSLNRTDVYSAVDYMTKLPYVDIDRPLRAQHPNAQNKMLFNAFGAWVGFDAFDLVDPLLTQPFLVHRRRRGWVALAQQGALHEGARTKGIVPHQGRDTHGPVRRQWRGYGREQDGSVLQKQPPASATRDAKAVAAE